MNHRGAWKRCAEAWAAAEEGDAKGQAMEEGEVEVEVAVMVREGVLAVAAVAALVALCRVDAAAAERRRRQQQLRCGLRPNRPDFLWPAARDAERGSWHSRISRTPAIGS